MGYDLIGYLVVGDKDLTPFKEAATEQAKKVFALVHSASTKFIDGALESPLSEEEAQYFSAAFSDIDIEDYPEMLKDKLDFIQAEVASPEAFVKDFFYFWKYPDNRDTNYRYYNGKQIVFSGAESFGDEPDGHGYQMLKLADMLGLFPVCNIE